MKKNIYLIDGSAYIYRAYHAIPSLSNSKGFPTNAVFGFTRMLIKLMQERSPDYAVMCFDAKGPTFRHEIYKDYKANRPPMPEDLAVQIPYIKDVTAGYNLAVCEEPGYEADDLIGTLARAAEQLGFHIVMVTGDKDFMQLVTDRAIIWDPMKDEIIDVEKIQSSKGVHPDQIVDVMGLSGDSSDNIPGVPGIGPKTALDLIRTFGSMEGLYEHVETISRKKQRENLIQFRDQAFLSRRLAAIDTRVPLSFDIESFKAKEKNCDRLSRLFQEMEFSQLQQSVSDVGDRGTKKYSAIRDRSALDQLVQLLQSVKRFALDTETTSENPMKAKLVGLSVAVDPDEAFYIPCAHDYPGVPVQLGLEETLERLKPVLESSAIRKVGQNIKYDWMVLERHGIKLAGVEFDTMLASYLLNPTKRAHNLDQIALDFLNYRKIKFKDLVGKEKGVEGFAQVPLEAATGYACEDADITLSAYSLLKEQLETVGLLPLMETVEMPLIPVLMDMELRGICVDQDRLRILSKTFEQQLEEIQDTVYQMAGEKFNINSSQQLGRILFEKLNLPVQKKTLKKTGYSTDVDVLTTLALYHELPAQVLRHRTLSKLKSTYTDALLELVDFRTGRIHTSFNQTVTATGRLSSSDPNLQNIPVRTEEGREIRSAFVPQKGWQLVSADYSQIELRILAHYSEDPILLKAFAEDEDIHARTAAEVFQAPPSLVTEELRRQAKAINFGIIYGMSPFGLSKQLNISQTMADTYIKNYFARYKGVEAFLERTKETARQTGKASTLLNRIRLLPDINSSNRNVRQFAERTAINTPIQGTAADLLKIAMIRITAAIREKKLQSAMLLSVHDELVFEVPSQELGILKELVKTVMENVWELKVPLKVHIGSGDNWASIH